MSYLRIHRTFEQRFDLTKRAGEIFLPDTPELCDRSRTKVGVSIGHNGRMKPVSIFYKNRPRELGLDFLASPAVKIV